MSSKSRSKGQQQQSKIMDFMDADQFLEVPDTPDRLVAAAHSSDHYDIEKRIDASNNSRVVSKDYVNGIMRNQPTDNHKLVTFNGNRRLFISPENCSNSQVSQLGSSCSLKNTRPMVETARHEKGKALCNSNVQRSNCQKVGGFADPSEQTRHGNASRKGGLSLNGFSAIDSLDGSSKSCKPNNTLKIGSSSDHGKGVGLGIVIGAHHKAENNSAFMQPYTSSRVPQRKMLVRNGCISPHNIAKSKHVAEKHETGSMAKEVHGGSGTMASNCGSCTVDIKDLIAEAKDSRRCKGKGVSRHPSSCEVPDARNGHLSHRRSILKEASDGSSDLSEGWRTTHNHTKERGIEEHKDHRNEQAIQHLEESDTISSQRVHDPPQTASHHAHKLGIKRQREGDFSSHIGNCSTSRLDDSTGEPSTSRPKRSKSVRGVSTLNSVSEPNTRHANNEDSSVRARQVEEDGMMARELQEQLYNEEHEPAVEIDEMDSRLATAMALHWDNSSRHAGGRHAYRRRGPPILNTNQYTRPITSRRPSIRRRLQPQARLTDRFLPRSRRTASTSTPRNSIFPPNMDVDMRMQILETLEDIGDMRVPNDLLQVGREFNEDDYEILLALDEDNDRHGGATRAQINNLPESTVQAENLQECAICLETPTIGETIRHLPCLHRFHKECIDQWLRRKTSCPVCKSSIT